MNVLNYTDKLKTKANRLLNPKTKSALGQFFTPQPICLYMAFLFKKIEGDVNLLDPGCGPGSLTAAFVDEAIDRNNVKSINVDVFDVEHVIIPYVQKALEKCKSEANSNDINLTYNTFYTDFLLSPPSLSKSHYTHVIMNPPYKKIGKQSDHRKALKQNSIDTVNLYSGFIAMGIKLLAPQGELVAIVPRSFCNGAYYKPFREVILKETSIKHIHIFDSRVNLFKEDKVLQENIIIHLVKGKQQSTVTISSSPSSDFQFDKETNSISATDQTIREVGFNSIVNPNDKEKFIHIAANARDQEIINRLSYFNTSLIDLNLKASTGPVVDFRLKQDLRKDLEPGAVPLIYPQHLINGKLQWPFESKKPNAIINSVDSKGSLWANSGYYVIVKRFSSKEEKRRIVATFYDSSLPTDLIGFDNKLNVYHFDKKGISKDLALGLFAYLNSTLLDKYYRLFGGHTQVNATDLKNIPYPSIATLEQIGKSVNDTNISQAEIDKIIEKEIIKMSGNKNNPLENQNKLNNALNVLKLLGMPVAQQNERSALTLLALIDLPPNGAWSDIKTPLIGVTPIMDWCKNNYGKEYAPNSRETFRRQTLHQFIEGGICLYNPDKPNRPVNSPKACYQIAPDLYSILKTYDTSKWAKELKKWLSDKDTLVKQYAKEREMELIPLTLPDGTKIKLSPGDHSQLIRDIVKEFGPRFAPGAEVIYLGDTGAKSDFFRAKRLAELGVVVNRKGKLPDVVLYWAEKDWLLLVESVTSHGPVDSKRHKELAKLFENASSGLVYVTAFPNRKLMAKYVAHISWETEVWTADAPTHMIHFNGDKFLGPHN